MMHTHLLIHFKNCVGVTCSIWRAFLVSDLTGCPQGHIILKAPDQRSSPSKEHRCIGKQSWTHLLFPSISHLFSPPILSLLTILPLFCPFVCPYSPPALTVFSVLPNCWKASKTERASKASAPSGLLFFLLLLSSQCFPASLSFRLRRSGLVVPPLMCKWLDDGVKGKHELCFPGSWHAQNSWGFIAARNPSDPN